MTFQDKPNKKPGRIVMIYPQQGFSGTYVKHMPLSLLYAVSEAVKAGYDAVILDTRVAPDWKGDLRRLLAEGTLCVGISVMSGAPIRHAVAIGRFVKSLAPDVPVVWGGPHATFDPLSILSGDPNCDYVVSGYGAHTFHLLCDALAAQKSPSDIAGVSWREEGGIRSNAKPAKSFEHIDFRDIPYRLISDYGVYGQLGQGRRIFSMYSAYGCPYRCSFCSSPAQYAEIDGKKWLALSATEVVDHIEHVVKTYGANYIYFIDDDSFPSLKHVEAVIDEIAARSLAVKLGFRGARINEILRMSDEFLDKLTRAGTDILHIGAESGSDRILALLRKDCTSEDILACNRKLARHAEITAAYNFIMGVPTETLDELKATRDLMLRLVEDHPNCLVFPPNTFRPLPGTELYELATREWKRPMPASLADWENIEVEGSFSGAWQDRKKQSFGHLLLIASYFVDNKAARVKPGLGWFGWLAKAIHFVYRPFALFRLRHGFDAWLWEYPVYRLLSRLLSRFNTSA
ncbi:MAG: B12-binding domain-containing radical SAM protein [Rhodospirillales bacterium]|nr:B12-binding domain-containing radical SAM protein [Rhodospirillales bacterium]